ncbi:MAG TPA: hypothetical protein PKE51_10060 [Gemmatimonadaceae bacterium]|nr:hypothetical protein [Gemmatimonadaceae bacterium]
MAHEPIDPGPVVTVQTRVVLERGRWVVLLDVVCLPEAVPAVECHRLGDYDTRARAELVAAMVMRTAHRTAPPSLGF